MSRWYALLALVAACGTEPLDSTPSSVVAPMALAKLGALSTTTTNGDSLPRGFANLGATTLFWSALRKGLWRTDGTPSGTTLVRDLEPTLDSFHRTPHLVVLGTRAYWIQQQALWSTDGTAAGTTRVADFASAQYVTSLVVYQDAIYFGTNTTMYRSDGTAAGTQAVVDVQIAAGDDYYTQGFQLLGDKLYFPCALGAAGQELCVTDGTAAGTRVVKDLRPGIQGSGPRFLGRLGARLLFSAQVPDFLRGLWVTDGTEAGTIQLLAPAANADAIDPYEEDLAVIGANAYVPCYTAATGFELCRTNGTAAGTSVIDLIAGTTSGSPGDLALLGTRMFFNASSAAAGRELWSSDGTPGGTSLFADLVPGAFDGIGTGKRVVGGTLFFLARAELAESYEVWKTDGTVGGTALVKKILAAGTPQRYTPSFGAALGGKLTFAADDGTHGLEPWVTDGTASGTEMLRDLTPDASAAEVLEARAFAKATYYGVSDTTGIDVWRGDAATVTAYQPFHQNIGYGPFDFTPVGARLYYTGRAAGENALWQTDGAGAPVKVRDLPGSAGELTALGNRLGFTGTTPNLGVGFWLSDGTLAGTVVTDALNARRLGAANGRFWLTGLDGGRGNELWTSDGVTTRPVKDIRAGSGSSEPGGFAAAGALTVFAANDGVSGTELWRTDGTDAGTLRVKDLRAGAAGSGPFGMLSWKGTVLFWAAPTSAYELWRTDGTEAGTTLVKAIPYGGDGVLVPWGDHVFFAASDPATGVELWRTDGTPAGTVMVRDGYPGVLSSAPRDLVLAGPSGPLFFVAEEPATGRELWRLDDALGTPELAAELAPGPASSNPRLPTFTGTHLMVAANDGAGYAVYAAKLADEPPPDGAPGTEPDASGPDGGGGQPNGGDGGGCCASSSRPHDAWPVLAVLLVWVRGGRRSSRSSATRRS